MSYIFGWDISTAIIGLTIMKGDGEYVSSHYFDLRKQEGRDLLDLAETFEKSLEKLLSTMGGELWQGWSALQTGSELRLHTHYVEDRLAGFTRGFSNQGTLMKLGAFNYLVSWIVMRTFEKQGLPGKLFRIHPATVKAVMAREGLIYPKKMKGDDKKIITTNFVAEREPTFPLELTKTGKPKPYCFDMADSYVVARAGILKGRIVTHGAGKKSGGGESRPRQGEPKKRRRASVLLPVLPEEAPQTEALGERKD